MASGKREFARLWLEAPSRIAQAEGDLQIALDCWKHAKKLIDEGKTFEAEREMGYVKDQLSGTAHFLLEICNAEAS